MRLVSFGGIEAFLSRLGSVVARKLTLLVHVRENLMFCSEFDVAQYLQLLDGIVCMYLCVSDGNSKTRLKLCYH